MRKVALLSVYNKDGIVDFARCLINLGYSILSSGGTAKFLAAAGIPVTDVADMVGEPILGHKVVTLSREVHGGLLADDSIVSELEELEKLGIPFIELVFNTLYPLGVEIAKSGCTPNSVRKQTDIGGPCMLRSGAKGRRIVICDPTDCDRVLQWIEDGKPDEDAFLTELAAKAEFVVAGYAGKSAMYHGADDYRVITGVQNSVCKYGENGYQTPAALYSRQTDDPLALECFKLVAGGPPSYNNLCDLDRMIQTMTHIAAGMETHSGFVPKIAIAVKHGNPCGAAIGEDASEVLQKMISGDLRAIFGGLVMTNFEIGAAEAEILLSYKVDEGKRRLLDGIVAPNFSKDAIELLKRKGDKCRFLENPALGNLGIHSIDTTERFRYVRGGFLVQPNYTFIPNLGDDSMIVEAEPSQCMDLLLAWAIGSTSNSNTVTLVKDGMLIGNGVGQQDRVGCCQLALNRAKGAGHDTNGAAAYSDSFFPFHDGPQLLLENGIKAIFTSSGSIADDKIFGYLRENGIGLIIGPDKDIRGFLGH